MHRTCIAMALAVVATGLLTQTAPAQSLGGINHQQMSDVAVEVPSVVGRSALIGHTDPSRVLHLSISLPPVDSSALEAYVDSVSNPKSRNYHNFLTPEEVGTRFGATNAQVQSVVSYLTSNGISVKLVAKNHLSILADATVTQAEAAFSTTINEYQTILNEPGRSRFFALSQKPKVPTSLAPVILDVEGLENFTMPMPKALTPTQSRVLYNLAPIYNGGMHGEGRNIAISNFDGYRLTNVPLFYTKYALPAPAGGVGSNITVVAVSGGAGSGTPSAEGDLDIQMVLGMAPLCNFTIYDGGASDLIGVLTREANDNKADVISESYGWNLPAATATAAHNQHLAMSAQGITYMAATGDSGTSIEPYSYPNYEPEVLMVGGTVATTDASGNRTSEVGWSGSGGGWSTNTATFNTLPSWLHGTGVPTNVNHRIFPDVAFHASSSTGAYSFYLNGTLTSGYVGTSFASPVFAGALGIAEQKIISQGGLPPNGAGKQRFGRIQDLIYSQNGRSDVWFDITSGSNGKLPDRTTSSAHAGWDYVTGWGPMNLAAFASTQVATSPDFSIAASPASQTVLQGNGTSYNTTVSAVAGFTGTVNLTVSGLPTGASGTFSPTSVTGSGSSTLSVTTLSSTPAGSSTLTITGTSGTIVHSTTATLVVTTPIPPDFTITATPATQSVAHNASVSYTVTITPSGGFTGVVALSATGVPASTTGTFTPASITGSGSSTFKITTTTASARGTYTLTLKGTSGSTSHTTTVTLTITRR
jgi:subtilase family serine protease